jgi:hypothetical protein
MPEIDSMQECSINNSFSNRMLQPLIKKASVIIITDDELFHIGDA